MALQLTHPARVAPLLCRGTYRRQRPQQSGGRTRTLHRGSACSLPWSPATCCHTSATGGQPNCLAQLCLLVSADTMLRRLRMAPQGSHQTVAYSAMLLGCLQAVAAAADMPQPGLHLRILRVRRAAAITPAHPFLDTRSVLGGGASKGQYSKLCCIAVCAHGRYIIFRCRLARCRQRSASGL